MPFQEYSPGQAALLPLHVRDVLGEGHRVFLISAVVEKQDLSAWEAAYSDEGQRPYHPALLRKMLLHAFALGVRGSRKIEQRVKEDLGFRYLSGGAKPDHKTICEFLRRHGRRVNDLFTAVLEQLQRAGLEKWGWVALDSTRVKANASRDRVMTEAGLRQERARKRCQVRRWQKKGVLDRVFRALQEQQIVVVTLRVLGLDSTSVKVHPDGARALKKMARKPSDARAGEAPPRFIWSPQMSERP